MYMAPQFCRNGILHIWPEALQGHMSFPGLWVIGIVVFCKGFIDIAAFGVFFGLLQAEASFHLQRLRMSGRTDVTSSTLITLGSNPGKRCFSELRLSMQFSSQLLDDDYF